MVNYILLVIILVLACILSFIAGFFTMWQLSIKWLTEYCTSSCRRPYSSYNRNDFNYSKIMSGVRKIFYHDSLREFDPFDDYSYESNDQNIKTFSINGRNQEQETMSNLIANMILKEAPVERISDAIKYSMVVIECKKHKLNYEKAYKDFNIEELKKKYL